MRAAGRTVHMAVMSRGGAVPDRLAAQGIPVHRLGRRPEVDVAAAARLTMLTRRLRPDVMIMAGKEANRCGIPVVLDPVGCGATQFRTRTVQRLITEVHPTVIRGNASEIRAAVSDALRLNTGPQTDQDAIREAEALLSNVDNREYVMRRLPTVMANNDRLRAGRQRLLQERRSVGGPAQSGAPDPLEGRTATGPNNERLVRRGGQWVPQ
jgi:hypothetical protein